MSANLQKLEQHLATRSYLEGYTASQADVHVFTTFSSAPDASTYPHAARWYTHIKSYAAEHGSLPGSSKAGAAFTDGSGDAAEEADDDEVDLFGDDDEDDAEAERVKAERVAAYNAKKAGKPRAAAKSVVTLDVKPWDDKTDMEQLEKQTRSVEMDGLVWGLGKLVPVGYGINKLQINLVIEDEKVSLDELQEKLEEFEEYIMSTDVVAMQKL